jgi:hypothetical protein
MKMLSGEKYRRFLQLITGNQLAMSQPQEAIARSLTNRIRGWRHSPA